MMGIQNNDDIQNSHKKITQMRKKTKWKKPKLL